MTSWKGHRILAVILGAGSLAAAMHDCRAAETCEDLTVVVEASQLPVEAPQNYCTWPAQAHLDLREIITGRGDRIVIDCLCPEE